LANSPGPLQRPLKWRGGPLSALAEQGGQDG